MEIKVTGHVKFVDNKRRTRDALLVHVHDNGLGAEAFKEQYGSYPCVNLVAVIPGEDRKDPHGNQTEHFGSVVYKNPSSESAGGMYYFVDA